MICLIRPYSAVLLLLLSACLWRSYEDILVIHLDVLTQMADKLSDVAASAAGPSSQGVAEYVYPARRARQFLQQFPKHSGRSSYRELSAFLDRYDRMVADVDAVRPRGPIDVDKVKNESTALHEAADAIRKQVAAGD